MQCPSGSNGPAADMIFKRIIATTIVLCLGPLLGSCGGGTENGFTSYVADHWPHWAGGMPDDVPPRPGAPGYDEFIAHGQTDQDATESLATSTPPVFSTTKPPGAGEKPVVSAAKTSVQHAPIVPAASPAPVAQGTPSGDRPTEDPSVVKGGLY
jgi:hypothetical protein